MNNKTVFAFVSALSALSFHALASDVVAAGNVVSAQSATQTSAAIDEPFRLPPDYCCNYRHGEPISFCPYPYSEQETVSMEEMMSAAYAVVQPQPIYIGGSRYTLNKSNFTPIYETRTIFEPCSYEPIVYRVLTGYEATFAVDGDFGQDLFFDISGRSNKSMTLKASCGSFSASDSGTKWVLSKSQNTARSCRQMTLKYTFSNSAAPSYIDLNIMISEQL
ncbi:hypothetical protein N473_06325 [Pseudoalteromonas luteoviolacea CPMOR-1]|uniref:Uncharacterized protein n=1 Tax=Pseudoalteromonas luteoviolacea CPMOR-1 TaxID=1365248 RepID=A0A167H0F6_9GAMM|nr:hypothetical protein [Pseudoalteromonas luteoviolacea]KZN57497.1 hypothetical protein N473_06325 [Pseudoalteromonas luteoviolacea CPMOR-1]